MFQLLAQSGNGNWLTASENRGEGEMRFHWAGLPESWSVFVWLVFFVIVIGGILWLYGRESKSVSGKVRGLLATLRMATILSLMLLLFKPSVFYQQVSIVRPAVAILRDESISIVRGDQYKDAEQAKRLAEASGFSKDQIASGEITRQQLINKLVGTGNPELLKQIRLKANLDVRDFSVNTNKAGSMMTIFEKADGIRDKDASDPAVVSTIGE